jgi:hypothetical protein
MHFTTVRGYMVHPGSIKGIHARYSRCHIAVEPKSSALVDPTLFIGNWLLLLHLMSRNLHRTLPSCILLNNTVHCKQLKNKLQLLLRKHPCQQDWRRGVADEHDNEGKKCLDFLSYCQFLRKVSSFKEQRWIIPMQRATGWTAGFDSRQWQVFFFFTAFRPVLGPAQPRTHQIPVVLSAGVKRQGHEANHSPPSSAEVKNGGAVTPLPHMFS